MKTFLIAILVFITFSLFSQNNPPVALPDTAETLSQVPVTIDILQNDYDPDGDGFYLLNWSPPRHGTADTSGGMLIYRSYNYVGWDSLRYRLRDEGTPPANSDYTWVYFNVLENPDVPVAVADTFEVLQLVPVQLDILANDMDLNGDELKILEVTYDNGCQATISADSLTVTVVPSYSYPTGSFIYSIVEQTPQHYVSNKVQVILAIIDNPDIPVAVDDEAETVGGMPIVIPVMNNDYDPQGEDIELKEVSPSYNGTVTIMGDEIRYVPQVSFMGRDSFNYRVREVDDPDIYSYRAWVKVNVSKNPDCPVGVTDYASGTTFVEMTLDVLPNDYDVNGDAFELWQVEGTDNASISIVGDRINYTSSPLSVGIDSVFYRIRQTNDPEYYSEWTPVYIDLAVNPDFPIAVDDYASTYAGVEVSLSPISNDIPANGDTLIMFGTPIALKGRVLSQTDSVFTYIPYANAKGTDSIRYIVSTRANILRMAEGKVYVDIVDQHYTDSLEINNINAGVNASGTLFADIIEIPSMGYFGGVGPHFRYPKGEMKNTIFNTELWLGGLDADDSLHLAGQRYKQVGFDYQPGPISEAYNEDHFRKYGRIWNISKEEVEFHRNNWWKEGYEPIEPIASWPGNGDPSHGEAEQLAPFHDENNDGIYQPLEGDYPLIRGDQTLFFMFNDDRDHKETSGGRLGLEVHAMVYGYDAPWDTALYNTVFVHYDLINRSGETYHDTYAGMFVDVDLGFAWDDYVGSDVERASFFVYNGREVDGDGEPGSYGENPPAQAITVLAGPFMDPDGEDNPDGGCDFSVNGQHFGNGIQDDERLGLTSFSYFNNGGAIYYTDPSVAEEYYLYMQGYWKDGTSMLYGGNGHMISGAVGPECRFMFPGDSDPLNWGTGCVPPNGGYNQNGKYWTEEEAANIPFDRRGLGSMGPFTFAPGDVQEIELALVVGRGENGPMASVVQVKRQIDALMAGVHDGGVIVPNNQLSIKEENRSKISMVVYPNPAKDVLSILVNSDSKTAGLYRIFDMQGRMAGQGQIVAGSDYQVNIHSLSAGIYFIFLDLDGEILTRKFIKL